ncbi:MAG TPA: YbhB/YbcL family Raf kinase inhibitor-like protein [Spirochaetia bacterium]|nr:YbhB/YbcL family Raf kinase inhibitor-like protein [Spirochaetia bacterium]
MSVKSKGLLALSFVVVLLLAVFPAIGQGAGKESGPMSIQLASTAFAAQTAIPAKYSCRGEDISPPLSWSNVPSGVKSFALIVEDPDAPVGIWVHWVYFDIPASVTSLPEGVAPGGHLADGSIQGVGSSHDNRFHGPCPPSGRHRYYFNLYALDTLFSLPASTNKAGLLKAMEGHVLAQGQLMGYFPSSSLKT